MQADGLIVGVPDKNPPVAPMPVRISHEIIDNIHHIILAAVKTQHIAFGVAVMVLAVDFKGFHGYNRIFFRGDIAADTDFFAVKTALLIKYL